MKLKQTARMLMAASAIAMCAAVPAQAAPMSFYSYAERLNGSQQRNYALSMIRNYENVINIYRPLVEKYGHHSWAASIVANYNWYQTELEKYQTLIGLSADAPAVYLVDTSVTTNNFTQTSESAETETGRTERIVEETLDFTVNVYLEVTVHYQKTVTTKNMEGIFTTYHYSDGSTRTTVGSRVVSTSDRAVTREENFREFVRSYTREVPTGDSVNGTPTANVLTVDEYLARDDVSLDGTNTYTQAVLKVNNKINTDYITRESGLAPYGRALEVIGAPVAWSRGWTGEGSRLAILDTGIDLDHSEFADRIVATECFTRRCSGGYETVQDRNTLSHGTHVAGIAAAALDGVGTTGVAPDAELLIGKVAYDNGFYDITSLGTAIGWAVNNGADAINVSGNYNVDTTYRNSVVSLGDGVYRSNDTRSTYATNGYSNLMTSPYMLPGISASMSNNEAVLVMSAGNQGLAFPTFPAHWAIAEDENGELLLDGRAIVVGNWDIRLNQIASTSNRAGTMCFEFTADGSCASDRRISDWYIMAPGQWVASTSNDGEYRTNSGTSMAAPAVTGAVGVIHQMWPYMTGENIVQLLLNTADKTITGYDVNVHGQGLLDLDEATSPQGYLGIPTTGRVDGARTQISGGIALQGGGSIASLESFMAVDAYDRNFEINGNSSIAVADTRTANPVHAGYRGFAPDYYFGYAGGTVVNTELAALNISNDGSLAIARNIDNFTVGVVNESNNFLGNYANNAIMSVSGATTAYIGYNVNVAIDNNTSLFGNALVGVTDLTVNDSMMRSASSLISNSATLGIRTTTERHTFGLVASLPVAVAQGSAEFVTPTSVSAEGDIDYTTSRSSLAAQRREFDLGMFNSYNIGNNASIDTHVEARFNYAGTTQTSIGAGATLTWRF